jgi:hypothetical protein
MQYDDFGFKLAGMGPSGNDHYVSLPAVVDISRGSTWCPLLGIANCMQIAFFQLRHRTSIENKLELEYTEADNLFRTTSSSAWGEWDPASTT